MANIHLDNIDQIACTLADSNRIELAWFLRGFADKCYGVTYPYPLIGEYREHYQAGRDAARDSGMHDAFLAIIRGGADTNPSILIAFIELVEDRFGA